MRAVRRLSLAAIALVGSVGLAQAQTADEIIEKYLAATGGRAALAKLESRVSTGSVLVSAQGADIPGTVEIYNKAPNRTRSVIRLDLSAFGGAEMVVDQRCDGKTAFASNSMQGDREITGNQLENMLNATFPSPLLSYKETGTKVELAGKEKVGERDAFVVTYTPKTGSASKQYYDATTFLLLRTVMTVDAPELGGQIEQTSDVSDYRDVDGLKIPFSVTVVNSAQTITISLSSVEHNKALDDAMFSRPVAK